MERKKYLDRIFECLAFLKTSVKSNSAMNFTDHNIYAENFFRDLFNFIYKYDLKNLNLECSNTPGIDLGDKVNKVAFQITSDNNIEKLKETVKKFFEENLDKTYDRLIIFIIGSKKKYRNKKIVGKNFVLDIDADVLDIGSLNKDINNLTLDQIRDIHNFLINEIKFPLPEEKTLVEEEKEVTLRYIEVPTIKAKLSQEGYKLVWPARRRVPELLLQGYELVYEIDEINRKKYRLVCKDNRRDHDLLLMKAKI